MRFSQTFRVAVCGLGLALFVGCTSKDETRTFDDKDSKASAEAEHGHDHAHAHGPNGGHLLEVGEEQYHVEVVFDGKGRSMTTYILGPDAKTAFPIDAKVIDFDLEVGDEEQEIPLAAKPLEGEKEGTSSRFVAEGKAIPESIKVESDLNGHFHLDIGEDHFHVDLEHGDHAGHDHEGHDHKEEKKAEAPKAEPAKEAAKKEETKAKENE